MKIKDNTKKNIQVCAHWQGMADPVLMGTLSVAVVRGKEVFSFEYSQSWLKSPNAQKLDPALGLFSGPQYVPDDKSNFGLFLDSSPDRWGRVLMQRREAQQAKLESRPVRTLLETDYLLGVYDGHRMGALRFRTAEDSPFLDNQTDMASPPWTKLRELEYASQQLERDNAEDSSDYTKWLRMLIAPGGSLGGARPKASVLDESGHPWIAKFPSRRDEVNIGKWEYITSMLAFNAGVEVAPSMIKRFSGEYDTYLAKRFDRTTHGERIHFASAMTLLGKKDGDGGDTGVSYLDIAEFILKNGSQPNQDLEQLWRRIVFFIFVSNTDDHLRNHGFLLTDSGWKLSPAYDMNPVPTGGGLSLNITAEDNSLSLELAMGIAHYFRIKIQRANEVVNEVRSAVGNWGEIAKELKVSAREIEYMRNAFLDL